MYIPDTPSYQTWLQFGGPRVSQLLSSFVISRHYLVQNPNIHQYSLKRKPPDPVVKYLNSDTPFTQLFPKTSFNAVLTPIP